MKGGTCKGTCWFLLLMGACPSSSFLLSPSLSTSIQRTSCLSASAPSRVSTSNKNNNNSNSNSRRRPQDNYRQSYDRKKTRSPDGFVQRNFESYGEADDNGDDFDMLDDEDSLYEDNGLLPTFDFVNTVEDYGTNTATSTTTTSSSSSNANHFFSQKPLQDPSFVLPSATMGQELLEKMCQGAGITRPSRIQSMAWPVVLQGKHTIIADQTGSGKTLGYLIPLLQRALASSSTSSPSTQPLTPKLTGAPKILVLAPTAELADQVRAVCDKLATKLPFHTMVVTATGKYSTSIRDQIRMLQRQSVDILISTPGRLSTIVRTRNSGLDLTSRLEAIVLDEVDILMSDATTTTTDDSNLADDDDDDNDDKEAAVQRPNDTFGPQLRQIGQAVGDRLKGTQFIFVTATLPNRIVQTVTSEFPNVVQVRGPGLHRVAPSMTERLIDVSVPSKDNRDPKLGFRLKAQQLLSTLRMTRCRRTLIFCNTVESCRAVENLIKRSDRKHKRYHVRAFHNAMTPQARNANLELFSKQQADGARDDETTQLDSILVCTDRAGRGVDFGAAPVDHVVLFDFPRDPADYVRRVGRTARAGRTGTCTVFAYGWQLPIARSVMGKTLSEDGFSINTNLNDDDNVELRGGVQARRQQKTKQQTQKKANKKPGNTRDLVVKDNIEGGRLWKS